MVNIESHNTFLQFENFWFPSTDSHTSYVCTLSVSFEGFVPLCDSFGVSYDTHDTQILLEKLKFTFSIVLKLLIVLVLI